MARPATQAHTRLNERFALLLLAPLDTAEQSSFGCEGFREAGRIFGEVRDPTTPVAAYFRREAGVAEGSNGGAITAKKPDVPALAAEGSQEAERACSRARKRTPAAWDLRSLQEQSKRPDE